MHSQNQLTGVGETPKPTLQIKPVELKDANEFVEKHHRHHKRVQGHRFSIGCYAGETLHGVAIVGRPTSGLDPKKILEVTRLCTDGTSNVCSMLYSAVARIGKELGYERVQTYIFESEHGMSLKASNWRFERKAHPSGRHRKRTDGKERNTKFVDVGKTLWVRDLRPNDGNFNHHRCESLV